MGIILTGGPCSVYDADAPPMDERVLGAGIARAWHLLWLAVDDAQAGRKSARGEQARVRPCGGDVLEQGSKLFEELPPRMSVWMSHGDEAMNCRRDSS